MAILIPSTLQLQAPWKRGARGMEFFQLLLTLSEHPFFNGLLNPAPLSIFWALYGATRRAGWES